MSCWTTTPLVSRRWRGGYCRVKVQLSEACEDEAARARRLSWPVRQLGSHHLALLAGPGQVARELRD
jgi:hypothetical protein